MSVMPLFPGIPPVGTQLDANWIPFRLEDFPSKPATLNEFDVMCSTAGVVQPTPVTGTPIAPGTQYATHVSAAAMLGLNGLAHAYRAAEIYGSKFSGLQVPFGWALVPLGEKRTPDMQFWANGQGPWTKNSITINYTIKIGDYPVIQNIATRKQQILANQGLTVEEVHARLASAVQNHFKGTALVCPMTFRVGPNTRVWSLMLNSAGKIDPENHDLKRMLEDPLLMYPASIGFGYSYNPAAVPRNVVFGIEVTPVVKRKATPKKKKESLQSQLTRSVPSAPVAMADPLGGLQTQIDTIGTRMESKAANIGKALVSGAEAAASAEAVKILFTGMQAMGVWHPALEQPAVKALMEVAVPYILAVALEEYGSDFPFAKDAAKVLSLAAEAPAMRLGMQATEQLGTIFRAVAMGDTKALNSGMRMFIPAGGVPPSDAKVLMAGKVQK